jgi:DNA-binding CsgD family transcriptional regulator
LVALYLDISGLTIIQNLYVSSSSYEEVKKICMPFLNQCGLSHFWYSRFYEDGSFIDLGIDPEWFMFMLEHNYFDVVVPLTRGREDWPKKEIRALSTISPKYSLLNIPDQYIDMIVKKYKIFYSLNIISPKQDYLENFGFSAPSENHECIALFARYFGVMKSFGIYFSQVAKNLISDAETNGRIMLSPTKTKEFWLNKVHFHSKEKDLESWIQTNLRFYYISTSNGDIKITARLRDCLSIFAQGGSAKDAANILNLSVKTIENHMQKLREKTGLTSRKALIDAFVQSGL